MAKGNAIVWTDSDLDDLAVASDADKETAAIFWKKHAPEEARDILDAETEDIPVE